jgi:predicted site-specific integrase-resolvase
MEEQLITTPELCDWLRITRQTASRWRQEGMPYYGKARSLRYDKEEVKKWLEEQRQKEKQK